MIKNKLYPTTLKMANEEIWLTDNIQDIAEITSPQDYMNSYFIGEINYNDLPNNLKIDKLSLDENGNLSFAAEDNLNVNRSHSWGFVKTTEGEYTNSAQGLIYFDGENFQKEGGDLNFINKIKMCNYATSNKLVIYIRAIVIPTSDIDDNGTAYGRPPGNGTYQIITSQCEIPIITENMFSQNSFELFLDRESNVHLNFGTWYIAGNEISLSFVLSDFVGTEENPYEVPICRKVIASDYTLFAQITHFSYYDYGTYISGNDDITQINIVPFIEWDDFNNNKWIFATCGQINTALRVKLESENGNFITHYGLELGGLPKFNVPYDGEVYAGNFYVEDNLMTGGTTGEEYWYAKETTGNNYPGYGRNGIIRGRHITEAKSTTDNIFDMKPLLSPFDIWKTLSLYHKIDKIHMNKNDISPSKTYTPQYSTSLFESNKPKDERVVLDYQFISSILMNWQQPDADITINTYNPNPPIFPVLYSLQDLTSIMKIANNYPYYENPIVDSNFFAMVKLLKEEGSLSKNSNEIISGENYSFSIKDVIRQSIDDDYIFAHLELNNFSNERNSNGELLNPIIEVNLNLEQQEVEPIEIIEGDNFSYYQGETISYFSNYEEDE